MAKHQRRTENAFDGSVDPKEIARFAALADRWWDARGVFRPLHKLNPARIAYIRDMTCAHFGRDPRTPEPLAGLRLLDVGCGGGLLCEPMARLGAAVTGIDAAAANIGAAAAHAAAGGLAIDYRTASAESLVAAAATFDLVLNMEVIEHAADPAAFIVACCALVGDGGAMVSATLNRTPKAFALAIVGAEYVLRWLPPGSHDWWRFVRPAELAAMLRAGGLRVGDLSGLAYRPLSDQWIRTRDLSVNYLAFATAE